MTFSLCHHVYVLGQETLKQKLNSSKDILCCEYDITVKIVIYTVLVNTKKIVDSSMF